MGKSWQEKLEDNKSFPKVLKLEPNFPCGKALMNWGAKKGDSVVIAPALDVNELMSKVPKGKVTTLKSICEKLAKKHKTKWCCSLTTGIFITIVGNAAEEMGTKVPWWRTLKNGGELNPKFPGGIEKQKSLLVKEGHEFIKRGKTNIKYFVKDYEKKLV